MRAVLVLQAVAVFVGVVAMMEQALAAECKLTAANVYEQANSAVVRIFNVAIDPFEPREKVRYSVGTGFIIDKQGTILTNYHVLLDSTRINLFLADGRSLPGAFVAGDPILDIAMVRPLFSLQDFSYLEIADDPPPPVGSDVFAIGHPLGLKMSLSRGIISAEDVVLPITTMSWDAPYIQTDAAINPGNSGGPLLDACGKVAGMNTLGVFQAENVGFAIPASTLRKAIAQLKQHGHIIRAWIGISGQMADEFVSSLVQVPFTNGFVVETVEPGSAAAKAGLRGGYLPLQLGPSSYLLGGDIIKSVNGVQIDDIATAAQVVRSLKPGDKIKVEYFREGQVLKLETTLAERPILLEDLRPLYRNIYSQH